MEDWRTLLDAYYGVAAVPAFDLSNPNTGIAGDEASFFIVGALASGSLTAATNAYFVFGIPGDAGDAGAYGDVPPEVVTDTGLDYLVGMWDYTFLLLSQTVPFEHSEYGYLSLSADGASAIASIPLAYYAPGAAQPEFALRLVNGESRRLLRRSPGRERGRRRRLDLHRRLGPPHEAMKNLATFAVVLLASCADRSRAPSLPSRAPAPAAVESRAAPGDSPRAATGDSPRTAPAPEAPRPAPTPTVRGSESSPGPSLAGKVGGIATHGVPHVQHGTLVRDQRAAVPVGIGEVSLATAGCVNAGSEEEGARFAARAPTRSGAPEVTVTPVRGEPP